MSTEDVQPVNSAPTEAPQESPGPAAKVADALPSPEVAQQRPEIAVAGAFAGAFLFARILKRITS